MKSIIFHFLPELPATASGFSVTVLLVYDILIWMMRLLTQQINCVSIAIEKKKHLHN